MRWPRRQKTRGARDTEPVSINSIGDAYSSGGLDAVPLTTLLDKVRRRKACVVAIGLAVLDGLTELHGAGRWHGAVHAGNVCVARDGSISLSPAAAPRDGEEPERSLRTADVRAAGMLLCTLLGIRLNSKEPGREAATPLGMAVRAMALSVSRSKVRAGYEASQARLSLWEAAGRLASRQRQAQAREQLANLVAAELGEEIAPPAPVPSVAVAAAVEPAAAHAPRMPSWATRERVRGGVGTLVAVLAGCAVLTVAMLPGIAAQRMASGASTEAAPPASSPAPIESPVVPSPPPVAAASPSPARPVVLAPSSAGDVEAVTATVANGCAPGSFCTVTVEVRLRPVSVPRPVAWTINSVDPCTGAASALAASTVLAQAGWVRVVSWRVVRLPATPSALVALTESPARAASTPVPLTGASPRC